MLYEQTYIQTFTDRIAARASNNWGYTGKDMLYGFISRENLKSDSLYWRLWDTNRDIKLQNIIKFAKYDFGKYSLITNKNDFTININIDSDYIVSKKIHVTARSLGKNPVRNLLTKLGLKGTFEFHAHSTAIINEPSEFIRNTDFALDTVVEIDNKYAKGQIQNFSGEIKNKITKIFETIKKFIE
jgi:hypothetical protein